MDKTTITEKDGSEEEVPQTPDQVIDEHQKYVLAHYYSLAQKVQKGDVSPEYAAFKNFQVHMMLERAADRDVLLKPFFNKRGFNRALDREVELAKRYAQSGGCLLYLDIDQFKRFNDTLGHPQGDKLIKLYGTVIMSRTRSSDLWGRIGGDELAVFLVGADSQNAQMVAEKIRQEVIQEVNRSFPDLEWEQTVSIGITQIQKTNDQVDDTSGELAYRADKALYEAKKERNKTIVF